MVRKIDFSAEIVKNRVQIKKEWRQRQERRPDLIRQE